MKEYNSSAREVAKSVDYIGDPMTVGGYTNKPKSQVETQMDILVDNSYITTDLIEQIEYALEKITTSNLDGGVKDKTSPDECLVPLAEDIRNVSKRQEYQIYKLRNLLDRIRL